jgi:hypothetical protein
LLLITRNNRKQLQVTGDEREKRPSIRCDRNAATPHPGTGVDATRMFWYYIGVPFAKLTRRAWLHPRFNTKYNALQRLAYFSVPVAALLSILTGWAIHKPMQLHWLTATLGGYDRARIWHFWLMFVFILFVVPHVVLVLADGWDTLRSMIVGWSTRADRSEDFSQ